jgi:ribosomal protein S27AE
MGRIEIKGMRSGGSGRPTRPVQQINVFGKVIAEFEYLERACKKLGIGQKSARLLVTGQKEVVKGIRLRYKSKEDIQRDLHREIDKHPDMKFVYRGKPTSKKVKQKDVDIPDRKDKWLEKKCPKCGATHNTLCDYMGVAYKRFCPRCSDVVKRHNESRREMNGAFT